MLTAYIHFPSFWLSISCLFMRVVEQMSTIQERKMVILEHLDMLLAKKGSYIGPREMRKHATWYTRGLPGGAELRRQFNLAQTRNDFIVILNEMEKYNKDIC